MLSVTNHKIHLQSNLPSLASSRVGNHNSWFRDLFHYIPLCAMDIRELCSLYFGICAISILLNTGKAMLESMD